MGQASRGIIEDPERFWDGMIKKWGDRPEALCWSTRERQIKRFDVLSRVITKNNTRLLDLGCGTADFYVYMVEKGWIGTYSGIDISQKMLDVAGEKVAHKTLLTRGDIAEAEYGSHDYVILSGTFNHRFYINDTRQNMWMKKIIMKMWNASKIAMAFNMRSAWGWEPATPEIYAYNPDTVISICRGITSRMVFDHSYFPHDFTIHMFREAWK